MGGERNFKIGDCCRFRKWSSFKEEGYLLEHGCIFMRESGYMLIPEMRRLCGKKFTIINIENDGEYGVKIYFPKEEDLYDEIVENGYSITAEMLEHICPFKLKQAVKNTKYQTAE